MIDIDVPVYKTALEKAAQNAIIKIGASVEANAKKNAPVDSGFYRNNIKYDGKKEVTANADYSAVVEYGVQNPKIIKPKTAKALKFKVNGETVFAKSVKQATRKPNPVMRNAAKQTQKEVSAIVKGELGRV